MKDVDGSAAIQYSIEVVTKNYRLNAAQRKAIRQAVEAAHQGLYLRIQLMGLDENVVKVYTEMLGSFGKMILKPDGSIKDG